MLISKEVFASWRADCCKADIELEGMDRKEYMPKHTKGHGRKRTLTDAERAAHKKAAIRKVDEQAKLKRKLKKLKEGKANDSKGTAGSCNINRG